MRNMFTSLFRRPQWLLALLTAALFAIPARGAAPEAIVPYDHTKPLDGQKPDRVYLDYETFQSLWKAAKEARAKATAGPKVQPEGRHFELTSALHAARVEGVHLVVESRYTALTRGSDWFQIPFVFGGAGLQSLKLDGGPASLRDGALLVEKPGTHEIEAVYEVALPAGWSDVTWDVPPAAGAALALSLAMDDPARPEINGLPVVESTANGRRTFTAALGTASKIVLKRRVTAQHAAGADPATVQWRTQVFASPALERIEAAAEFTFRGQERRAFTLRMPADVTPVSFDIPGLESWVLRQDNGASALDLTLTQAARESFTARLIAERPVSGLPSARKFPVFSAKAGRTEHEMSLLATDDLEVRPAPGPQVRQIAFVSMNEEERGGFVGIGSYAASGATPDLGYELRPKTPERSAAANYVFQVSPGKLEISGGFELRPAEGEDMLEASFGLPAGVVVQGVTGPQLADWWREGDVLRLRFTQSPAAGQSLAVALNLTKTLARPDAATEAAGYDVAFTPLDLQGFAKIEGKGMLAAPLSVESTLRFNRERTDIREVDPESANGGFTVLAPFEIKRGFTFERTGWTATARLTPLAPKFDTVWVMAVDTHDTHAALATRVLVTVSRGSLSQLTFSTPATAPVFEISEGDDVRDLASKVEGDRRVYTATFQREVGDAAVFTLAAELAFADAASIPDIDFPGASKAERFVVLENRSTGRLTPKTDGLEPCTRQEVAFLPEGLKSDERGLAQFFRARPGWSLTVAVEKLATSAGQAALVLQGDLTTSLLRNGDEWVRAVYRLHNRTLQFLPVRLPDDAELVSVAVDGAPTRADRGQRQGVTCFLIPLIQTKPGQLSLEVQLVYRRKGAEPLGTMLHRLLDDPELPGLTVERTLWTVQLPAGYRVEDTRGGNMTRVENEGLASETMDTLLSELSSLSSIAASSRYDGKERLRSQENAEKLAERLNSTFEKNKGIDGERYRQLREQTAALKDNRKMVEEQAKPADGDAEAKGGKPARKFAGNSISNETLDQLVNKDRAEGQKAQSSLGLNDNVFWGRISNEGRDNGRADVPQQDGTKPTAAQNGIVTENGGGRKQSQVYKLNQREQKGAAIQSKADALQQQQQIMVTEPQVRTATPEAPQSAVNGPAQGQQVEFNNAQNRLRYSGGMGGGAAGLKSMDAAKPPAAEPVPPASMPTTPPPQRPESGKDDGDRKTAETDQGRAPAEGDAAVLATGHHALGNVFPEQPAAAHFKKVKDHATIDLHVVESARMDQRWPAFVAAGVAFFILLAGQFLLGRPRRAATTAARP